MRFPADELGRIRRGEITACLRPYEGRPSAYHPADRFHSGLYVIESVSETRVELDNGDVDYERKVRNTEEYVEVTQRTRLPLNGLNEDAVEALGFDDLADVIDIFRCDRGGTAEQGVWLIEFRYTTDIPNLLARPDIGGATRTFRGSKRTGHGEYAHGGSNVLAHEPEAVDKPTLDAQTADARELAAQVGADEAKRLAASLKNLHKRAVRTGVDITLEKAVIRHSLNEIERKMGRAA